MTKKHKNMPINADNAQNAVNSALSVKRETNGRWIKGQIVNPKTVITKDNARSLALARWQSYRDATASGILSEARAIGGDSIRTAQDAYALLAGRLYSGLMDAPDADKAYRLLQMLGGAPLAGEMQALQAQDTATGAITGILAALSQFAAGLDAGSPAIDGSVTDITDVSGQLIDIISNDDSHDTQPDSDTSATWQGWEGGID